LGDVVGRGNSGKLDANTQLIADADAYTDADGITNAISDAHAHPDAHPNPHAYRHAEPDAYLESYSDAYSNPRADADADARSNSFAQSNADSRSDCDANSSPDHFNRDTACRKSRGVLFRVNRAGGWDPTLSRVYQRRRAPAWACTQYLQRQHNRCPGFRGHFKFHGTCN
jgi:hypothetical protein